MLAVVESITISSSCRHLSTRVDASINTESAAAAAAAAIIAQVDGLDLGADGKRNVVHFVERKTTVA